MLMTITYADPEYSETVGRPRLFEPGRFLDEADPVFLFGADLGNPGTWHF